MALSIRSRIIFTLVAALFLFGVVTAFATFYTTKDEFSSVFDEELRHTALEVADKDETSIWSLTFIGQNSKQGFLVQVFDSSHNKLFLSKHYLPLPIAETTGFSVVTNDNGKVWRQYTVTVGSKIIQVAQPLEIRTNLAFSASLRILQPLLILLSFLGIAIWFIIVQSLQSLSKTAKAVRKRSPTSLSPIHIENPPSEVQTLVDAINHLLERLSDSLSAQQRFASDAAHELRTPLAAIKLQTQLLSRAKTDEDRQKYSLRLQQGVARATRLVEQLLTIARLDPDATNKPMNAVEIHEIAQGVAEDLTPIAQTKSISLHADTEPALTNGMADALRLMIYNLTDNAIRYTAEGGHIEISVRRQPSGLMISVTDDGPGIDPSERQRVFERFYRALGTKVSGTGLGLAIVHRIVDIHGGTITIVDGFKHKNDEGCGVSFVVTLPSSRN